MTLPSARIVLMNVESIGSVGSIEGARRKAQGKESSKLKADGKPPPPRTVTERNSSALFWKKSTSPWTGDSPKALSDAGAFYEICAGGSHGCNARNRLAIRDLKARMSWRSFSINWYPIVLTCR
jgi:hypothetical protein